MEARSSLASHVTGSAGLARLSAASATESVGVRWTEAYWELVGKGKDIAKRMLLKIPSIRLP